MIEIRLGKDYKNSEIRYILEKIKKVAPRELTYGMEADMDTVDVNIEDTNPTVPPSEYKRYSGVFDRDMWILIVHNGFYIFYQGESYSGESADELIHDMFYYEH